MANILSRKTPLITLSLTLAAVGIQFCPPLIPHLQFDWPAIFRGQLWRLGTGHLTHWLGEQLFWDGAVFLTLGTLAELRDRRLYVQCLIASILLIPCVLGIFTPQIQIYRGLSGLDTALFSLVCALELRDKLKENDKRGLALILAVFTAFIAKIVYECFTGQTFFVRESSGFEPLAQIHIAGAVCVPVIFIMLKLKQIIGRIS